MKKLFLPITIILIISVLGYSTYYYLKNTNKKDYDKSQLSIYEINGTKVESAGAPPTADLDANYAIREGVKLLNSGPFTSEHFDLRMPGDGTIVVVLKGDIEKSKDNFAAWLKSNNYQHLDLSQFSYTSEKEFDILPY